MRILQSISLISVLLCVLISAPAGADKAASRRISVVRQCAHDVSTGGQTIVDVGVTDTQLFTSLSGGEKGPAFARFEYSILDFAHPYGMGTDRIKEESNINGRVVVVDTRANLFVVHPSDPEMKTRGISLRVFPNRIYHSSIVEIRKWGRIVVRLTETDPESRKAQSYLVTVHMPDDDGELTLDSTVTTK